MCSPEDVKAFDDTFWTFHPRKFLPHGTEHPEKQPVFITPDNDNQNNASVLAITDGRDVTSLLTSPPDGERNNSPSHLGRGLGGGFEKILDMFDGNNEQALNKARARWKAYKDKGYNLRYWFQDEKGKWTEKSL